MWDIPSSNVTGREIHESYLTNAHAVIFVYSQRDPQTVKDVIRYYHLLEKMYPSTVFGKHLSIPSIILENKCDQIQTNTNVQDPVDRSWLAQVSIDQFKVSAKQSKGLNVAIKLLLVNLKLQEDTLK